MAGGRGSAAEAAVAPEVVVVGAGPGGLAVAAALARRGVPSVVLERSAAVGASWRGHYDRLHLHTPRRFSGLPGWSIPRAFGRWVARDDVVRYLELYAAHHRLTVRPGVEVTRVDRAPSGGWVLSTADGGAMTASAVVIATGYNHTPRLPVWPGVDTYPGTLLHASGYRNAERFVGQHVLVVGVGNTGAEIAVDLVEGGAAQVSLAVRTAPHIIRRSTLGWSAQQTGIVVRRLPVAMVDLLARVQARLLVPDLSAHGLGRPQVGLYSRVRQGSVPVQDVGLIAAVQSGAVVAVGSVEAFDGAEVVLADGTRLRPDAVIAATGYRQGLDAIVGHLGVLDDRGLPTVHGGHTVDVAPGLYFTGYTNPISGMFRELRLDAVRIARRIAGSRRGVGPVGAPGLAAER